MRAKAKFLSLAALLAGSAVAGPALTTGKTLVPGCIQQTRRSRAAAPSRSRMTARPQSPPRMYVQEKTSVSLFSKGGDTVVTRVRNWKMKSIYPEGQPEEKNQAMADAAIAEDAKAGKSQKKFKGPVKVFILAGPSNMEGQGTVDHTKVPEIIWTSSKVDRALRARFDAARRAASASGCRDYYENISKSRTRCLRLIESYEVAACGVPKSREPVDGGAVGYGEIVSSDRKESR